MDFLLPDEVLSIVAQQHDLVTLEQLERFGVSRRATAEALLQKVAVQVLPGVVLVGTGSWRCEELFAWWLKFDPRATGVERLASAPFAVATHESAAFALGLQATPHEKPSFAKLQPFPFDSREVSFTETVDATHWTSVEGLPVTPPLQTITDLLHLGSETEHVALVAVMALEKAMVDEDALESALLPFRGLLQCTDADKAVDVLKELAER